MKNYVLIASLITMVACGSTDNSATQTASTTPTATTTAAAKGVEGYPAGSEILDYSDSPGISKASLIVAGNVQQQGDYFNDQRNGSWTEYHGKGVVKSITTYVNGKKQGIAVELDDRGNLIGKSYYHNDSFDGESLLYNRGKIIGKENFQNGIKSGMTSKYYNDGKIQEESPYVNGQIHGTAKWYDQQGNVTLQYEYNNCEFVKKVE